MKTIKLLFCLLTMLLPRFAFADLVGPYTPDANTLILLHLDQAAGSSVCTNLGSLGGNVITCQLSSGSPSPAITTLLGFPSYSTNSPTAISFGNCESNVTTGVGMGYCYNQSLGNTSFYGDTGSAATPGSGNDYMYMTNLNIGNGGQSPFTLEALICPTSTAGNQDIMSTDCHNATANRPFFFRIASGTISFQFVAGTGGTLTANIPTTAQDPENGFVAGTWYHVAFTYDGTNGTLYWTKLDSSLGAAHVLNTGAMTLGTSDGAASGPLSIGNRSRTATPGSETFLGAIDEVRISRVCRAANQMQFYSPLVTITQNPVSQNVDYNNPVTFTVGASTTGSSLFYQWQFNSNNITGATNTTYTITNVASANAGYYDCVVTNSAGNSQTSSVAHLVVGAANFLNHRYSFFSEPNGSLTATDSIAGANGTLFGDANITGGQLVLDGTTGTYVQLPPGIVNGANQTALTVEFWATFGVNSANVYAFNFGNTNIVVGNATAHAFLGYSPHNASGQEMFIGPADFAFANTLTTPGVLDGQTVHVACVFDAPDNVMSIYTNGVLEATGPDPVGLGNVNDVFSYIGASLNAGNPYLNANFSELRIYNGAISSITIKQSNDQGPNILLADGPAHYTSQPVDASVPAGQIATFTVATVGYLPITYQWFKNGTLIPGATNLSYSFATAIGDNGATFMAQATNTIGATTYVTNSTTATLTVFVPPTLTWLDAADGGADSFWNTTSLNWTNSVSGGGIVAFSQTNGVVFDNRGNGSPSVDITASVYPYNITVNSSGDYSFVSSSGNGALNGPGGITKLNSDRLTIDVSNNLSGTVTISSGTVQVGANDSLGSLGSAVVTNNATLSFDRSDATLNAGNTIHGSGTVSIDGSGTVIVSGASDYTGSTMINSGILNLQSGSGLGAANTGTTVISGGQLYITANINTPEPLALNGVGNGNGALRKGGAGLTVENGTISLVTDSTISVDSGATLTLSNVVSGASALTATGSGALTLNTNNTFTGGFFLNGAIIGVNANNAFSTGNVTVNGAGRFVFGDGVTVTNAFIANTVSPGTSTGLIMVNDNTNGTVTTVSGPLSFAVPPANGGDFVGPVSSGYLNVLGSVSAPGLITIIRLGNVRFAGGGDYAEIQIRANTTSLGANNGIATNAIMDIGGNGSPTVPTYFDLNGFNQKLAGVKNTVTPANLGVVTNSGPTVKTLTLDLGGNSYSFSGAVAGNVALVMNSGTENFTGTNTYTGNTTVNGGTLELAVASIATNSTVTITNGATLQLDFAGTNQISSLILNGVSQTNGVYNTASSPAFITGSGSLQVMLTPTGPIAPTNSPTIKSVALSGTNIVLTGTNADNGATYYILDSTNVAKPRTQWKTVATNVANGSAFTFTVTNVVMPGVAQQFYILSSTNYNP